MLGETKLRWRIACGQPAMQVFGDRGKIFSKPFNCTGHRQANKTLSWRDFRREENPTTNAFKT